MTSTSPEVYSANGEPSLAPTFRALTVSEVLGATATIVLKEFEISGNGLHSASVGERPCVLLVEDDRALRRYLEVVLQRTGYAVISAGDGLEAMRFLLTARVDIVVTDALMPNLDGYGLCRFVRSSTHLAHLPIILLSALDPKNSTDESEQVNAFLAKPVSPDELIQTIHRLRRSSV